MSKEKTVEVVSISEPEAVVPSPKDELKKAEKEVELRVANLTAQIGAMLEQIEASRKQRDIDSGSLAALRFALAKLD